MQSKYPGREVITIFRVFIGIRLLVALNSAALIYLRPGTRFQLFETSALVAIGETLLLLVYLSLPWLQQRMQAWYLPVALAGATLGPLVENMLLLRELIQMATLAPASQPLFTVEFGRQLFLAGQFQLSILLLVPLILVSWLYSFRVTVLYVLASALFDTAIPLLFSGGNDFNLFRFTGEGALRSLIFLFMGYLINRLVTAQKRQNEELAEANRRLADYATTLEQLAISHERNRLAREFHDTLAHTLSALAVQLEAVEALQQTQPEKARAMLHQSLDMTRNGLNETRRAIQALRAAPLEDLGLRGAVEALARSHAERFNWQLHLELPEELGGLSHEIEHSLYRIIEEALRNVGQHAGARRVDLSLKREGARLELILQDDGRGFEDHPGASDGRFGLMGMRERAAGMGATLQIISAPGRGTRLELALEVEK